MCEGPSNSDAILAKKQLVEAIQKYQEQEITILTLNQKVIIAEMTAKAKAEQEQTYLQRLKELTIELSNAKAQLEEESLRNERAAHATDIKKKAYGANTSSSSKEQLLERQLDTVKS